MLAHMFITLFLGTLLPSSYTDTYIPYKNICMEAAADERAFASFRGNAIYRSIVEIGAYEEEIPFAEKIIVRHRKLLSKLAIFRKNDAYGGPLIYNYPWVGRFAPATLRYITIAGDLLDLFTFASPPRIVEVGVGCGGQCAVLHSVIPFEKYTLIDLPEVIPLVRKYLHYLDIPNTEAFASTEVPTDTTYDLFISNYAFSECTREAQLLYFEQLMRYCKRGFVLHNHARGEWERNPLSVAELVRLLQEEGFQVSVVPEEPCTCPGNVLITWTS
jgi:hypothetical protein